MFASVGRGDADCCIAPIENSLAGSIHRNYDLLLESSLTIAGETHLRIVHNLIAPPNVDLTSIRRVYSHPVGLAQCNAFFRSNPLIEATPVHDTAGAIRMVMERAKSDEAGIASADAADIYGGRREVSFAVGEKQEARVVLRVVLDAAHEEANLYGRGPTPL